MKTSIAFILLSIIIFSACSSPNKPERLPKIYGVFVDENGKPLANADICVIPDLPISPYYKLQPISETPEDILWNKLISFSSLRYDNHIKLKWSIPPETNIKKFIVERAESNNKNKFVVLKTIDVESLDIQVDYTFNDSTIVSGKDYNYRLIMVDNLGAEENSGNLYVSENEQDTDFTHSAPNPFFGSVYINFAFTQARSGKFEVIEKSSGISYLKEESVFQAGTYTMTFNAIPNEVGNPRPYRPGIYVASLELLNDTLTQKMIHGFIFDDSNCIIPLEVTKTDSKGRFEIDYKWFPDIEEYFRIADGGQVLGKFMYGASAKILARKTISEDGATTQYWVGQESVNVDKSKVVDIEVKGLKYIISK